jgi:hypothetical protein
MSTFEVFKSEKFILDLEESAFWLYIHNIEESVEFANFKFK